MAETKASTKKTTTKTAPKTTGAKKTTTKKVAPKTASAKKTTTKKTTTKKVAPKTASAKKATTSKKTTTKKVAPKTTTKVTKKVTPKVETKKEVKKDSFITKSINTIKDNLSLSLLCFICLLLIVNIIFITIGNKTKLVDGKEVVAEIDGLSITAEELYDELKETNGTAEVVSRINAHIIEDRLSEEDIEEAEEGAQTYLDEISAYYVENGQDWEAKLTDAGYENEEALFEEILLSYKEEAVVIAYMESKVTEEEIKEYYADSVYGTYTVKNILITPVTTSEMTEEEITAAETQASDLAKEAIAKLEAGEDWASVFAEYNTDDSAEDEGLLEGFTNGDVDEAFFNATVELEDEEYTTSPIQDAYGYNVILKVSSTEKDELAEIQDSIVSTIANTKLSEDTTLYNSLFIELREDYEFTIYDTIIKNAYDNSVEED